MSTKSERTVRVRAENRTVFADKDRLGSVGSRTVRVRQQDRVVRVGRKPNAADRTVYANED